VCIVSSSDEFDIFQEMFQPLDPTGFQDTLDPQDMAGMLCYQCTENLKEVGRMQCQVEQDGFDFGADDFDENFLLLEDDLDAWKGEEEFMNKVLAMRTNPCKLITNKVLQLVQLEEDSLLPIYLDLDGKDSKTKYQELKNTISKIQFQKRENSLLMAIEVQLREKEDTYSFILPDFNLEFVNIPQNSIFYTSL